MILIHKRDIEPVSNIKKIYESICKQHFTTFSKNLLVFLLVLSLLSFP